MLLALVSLAALYAFCAAATCSPAHSCFASVFVRPDNIILIFALLITAVAFGWRVLPLLATFVASFVACVAISKFADHPGWWAHFYFSCVADPEFDDRFPPGFLAAGDLPRAMRAGWWWRCITSDWPAILALFLAGWALLNRFGKLIDHAPERAAVCPGDRRARQIRQLPAARRSLLPRVHRRHGGAAGRRSGSRASTACGGRETS